MSRFAPVGVVNWIGIAAPAAFVTLIADATALWAHIAAKADIEKSNCE